jgi:hypothetical protein
MTRPPHGSLQNGSNTYRLPAHAARYKTQRRLGVALLDALTTCTWEVTVCNHLLGIAHGSDSPSKVALRCVVMVGF